MGLLLFIACGAWGDVQIVAHRGGRRYVPENTYAAAERCVALGVEYLEVDVQTSVDGVFYNFHDPWVHRTTNGEGWLKTLTSEEIDALDAGSWFSSSFAGSRVPRIDELLRTLKGRIKINFDVKSGDLERLVELVRDTGFERDCFFRFADSRKARRFRELAPDIPLKMDVRTPQEVERAALEFGAKLIETQLPRLTSEFLSTCRKHDMKIIVCAAENTPEEYERLLLSEADLIMLDDPDLCVRLRRQMKERMQATQKDKKMNFDFTNAVLVTPETLSRQEQIAVRMLLEEVEERSRIRWKQTYTWPDQAEAVVVVGQKAVLERFPGMLGAEWGAGLEGAEGYQLRVIKGDCGTATVIVAGNDARGLLFGIGRLLRELRLWRDKIELPGDLNIDTVPRYPLRGHQLGYRPKTNSYDGWTVAMWEQYFRDLAVFGANAVELIPPRSDDAPDSPHFPLPPMEMMKRMSSLADDYGLDVWIWYPAMDKDYSDPATVEWALEEWGNVFEQLPRVDAVFVPGGDPGHTQPKHLLALLEKQTDVLHRSHPHAQMWMSPQSFDAEWTQEFLQILKTQQPTWLSGIVFGPQNRISLEELRAVCPDQYPIRHYPDITHTVKCQFPVPDWDMAFAFTEDREPINPRPMDYANIIRLMSEPTLGFLCYSEGCNDDINKAVWSGMVWDPRVPVQDILREYARYFIGPAYEEDFAEGILSLERNWKGPLAINDNIFETFELFQEMEKRAGPRERLNWRFQQALYRAYYDAFVSIRLAHDLEVERRALDALGEAKRRGTLKAVDKAEEILDNTPPDPIALELRSHLFALAEALFQSVRMQLSVPLYKAIHVERGANLDNVDVPLNDQGWLKERFRKIRALRSGKARMKCIDEILHWTDPGPGGFYDDLGNLLQQPHLVRDPGMKQEDPFPVVPWRVDPEFRRVSLVGFQRNATWRMSWCRHAESRYDAPLQLQYEGLDEKAEYKVRVVYAGDAFRYKIRLDTSDGMEIHPFIDKKRPPEPMEFDIPQECTSDGRLTLSWRGEPGRGGNGRCCQVAEVWLIRKP